MSTFITFLAKIYFKRSVGTLAKLLWVSWKSKKKGQ